jgi:hypothetical protein
MKLPQRALQLMRRLNFFSSILFIVFPHLEQFLKTKTTPSFLNLQTSKINQTTPAIQVLSFKSGSRCQLP